MLLIDISGPTNYSESSLNVLTFKHQSSVLFYNCALFSTQYISVVCFICEYFVHLFSGINHGDFNNLNILVEPDESSGGDHRITAVLDFGDMSSGYYVYELAISIMHMMMEHPDPVAVGRPIMEGWESVVPLNREERDCLYLLVLCRFCQTLVMARHMLKLHPENEEYLTITSQKGIHILRQLWDLGKAAVERVWF